MQRVAENTRLIKGYTKAYSRSRKPIEVNFRELVNWIP